MNLMDLVRKRHDGPAWIVVEECGNGTGYNVSRHADAVALGVWPSRGYELHGYELKRSRGDVQKELDDPSKADAVGKFCDYWWLVVEDLAIIDGLVIPETWGILVPKRNVLRVHRKAPKRDATPVNRAFVAALTRRITAEWVPKHQHDELKKNALEQARAEVARESKWKKEDAERDLEDLRAKVAEFEKVSGVKISDVGRWEVANIARAVETVVKAREATGARFRGAHEEPLAMIRGELASLERSLARHETAKVNLGNAMQILRGLAEQFAAEDLPPPPPCDGCSEHCNCPCGSNFCGCPCHKAPQSTAYPHPIPELPE